jgi:hypothetical protein
MEDRMSTLTMTSEALGHQAGDVVTTFSAGEEAWLLAEGYASKAGYGTDAAAVLTAGSNAVNIVTGGNLVVTVDGVEFTTALVAADTPAVAAGKIDTALAGVADAAIVSSKLVITSVDTGSEAEVKVKSGTGTVLANLGLVAGTQVNGSDGGVGVSNTGPSAAPVADDLTLAANREPAPALSAVGDTGLPDPGRLDPAMTFTTADDDPNDADPEDYDYDPAGVNNDIATIAAVAPLTGAAAGTTAVTITGENFTGATSAALGGVNLTSFVVVDDETITGVSGAHAAGAVSATVVNPNGTGTKVTAYTYV